MGGSLADRSSHQWQGPRSKAYRVNFNAGFFSVKISTFNQKNILRLTSGGTLNQMILCIVYNPTLPCPSHAHLKSFASSYLLFPYMTNGILLTRHNQEIAQWLPDRFPHERVGSGHEAIIFLLLCIYIL